jgi:hypothetical protein
MRFVTPQCLLLGAKIAASRLAWDEFAEKITLLSAADSYTSVHTSKQTQSASIIRANVQRRFRIR